MSAQNIFEHRIIARSEPSNRYSPLVTHPRQHPVQEKEATMNTDVRGLPKKVWLVIRPTGEKHHIDKLDDIKEWAQGLDVTIAEYRLAGLVHTPSTKPLKKS